MRMEVRTDGLTMEEEVELNYEQNYVRVSTPGRNGASPAVMIQDYNLVIEFKQWNWLYFLSLFQ